MKTKPVYSLHISFWLLKNGLEFALFSFPYFLKEPPLIFWRNTFFIWLIYATYFYLNYSVFIPRFFSQKRYLPYLISILCATFVFVVLVGLVWNGYQIHTLLRSSHLYPEIAFNAVTLFFGSTALRMLEQWMESERKKQLLLQEVREAELLSLKSQMSPHFLFNTLNNIYGLAINRSEGTSYAIAQLRQMMMYVQRFKDGALIELKDEIVALESFIALNALRYDCSVKFSTHVTKEKAVEPMIFLPFIENAFKHGDTRAGAEIDILLEAKESAVLFSLRNGIDHNKRKDSTGGIGIQNIQRRLDLLYEGKWTMETHLDDHLYAVTLKIDQI